MTPETAETIALQAIAHIVADDTLRDRFVAMSGLMPEAMRARVGEPQFLASVLEFLLGHEPDILAFADASGVAPEQVQLAWHALGGGAGHEW